MKVGFVGLGNMGAGMAENLVKKGYDTAVFDVREEPMASLAAKGATAARSLYHIGAHSDVVFICVFDEAQVDQTVLGENDKPGVLASMRPGGVIVLNPTIAPSAVRRIADIAQNSGVDVLDAPITGGSYVAAQNGTLTFMVGGEASVLERVREPMQAMAKSIFHVGPLGTGEVVKIINNFVVDASTLVVREVLRLSRAFNIEEDRILDILNTGDVGSNWATRNWDRVKSLDDTYTTGRRGFIAMMTKDLELAKALGEEAKVKTPTLNALITQSLPDAAVSGITDRGLD